MSDDAAMPFIGPADQALFDIEDPRERADQLKDQLTPKLASLLDDACDLIEEVYGEGSLEPYRISLTPAHRPGAKQTKKAEIASAGLVVRGQSWYFQLRIECNRQNLRTRLFGLRGHEANPITQVLQHHQLEATRILDHAGLFLASDQVSDDFYADSYTIQKLISKLTPFPERDWRGCVTVEGSDNELPLHEGSPITSIYEFVALFPVFRAATDIFLGQAPIRRSRAASDRFRAITEHVLGQEDKFLTYARQFWEWDAKPSEGDDEESSLVSEPRPPSEDDSASEGGFKMALKKHYIRERRLRRRKIRHTLQTGDGRLRCEVPGCGFDYFAVYGELGREFAHVHHTRPVGGRAKPEPTRLGELAIVCANCHAMIHRGNQCREMNTLILHDNAIRPALPE